MRGSSMRSRCGRLSAALVMLLGVAGFAATPVMAKVVHKFEGSFVRAGSESLTDIVGVAVNSVGIGTSAGDVYVTNAPSLKEANNAVYQFKADGTYTGVKLTGAETPAGSFSVAKAAFAAAGGIAVGAKGDIYVADIAHNVVDVFNEAGTYLCQITGEGVTSPSECDKEASGQAPKFTPKGIAVGFGGELYVANEAANVIDKFNAAGELIGTVAGAALAKPTMVAVGDAGDLFVRNGGGTPFVHGTGVVEISATGSLIASLPAAEPRGLAADFSTGLAYVSESETIEKRTGQDPRIGEYRTNGGLIDTFAGEQMKNALSSLGVNASDGKVYVAELIVGVEIFSGDIVVPNVTIAPATAVEETAATLHGEVAPDTTDGGKEITKCQFEYVTQAHFEAEGFKGATIAGCAPGLPYATSTNVSAAVSGLAAATTYHVRIMAENAGATGVPSYSEPGIDFKTKGAPVIEAQSASAITRREATLQAHINPDGFDTHYFVEYGQSEAYGSTVPASPVDIGSGEATLTERQPISGLRVGTIYHYRVVASNSQGTVYGADETLQTVPVAGVAFQAAEAAAETAVIKAQVDPAEGLTPLADETKCRLQYVTEAQKQASGYERAATVPCEPATIAATSSGENVIVRLSGLTADTVYHYRVVVENEEGRQSQAQASFATFGIEAGGLTAGLLDEAGQPYARAGGHPYELTTDVAFNTSSNANGYKPGSGRIKDVRVRLPQGMVGNPAPFAQCPRQVAERGGGCPSDSQVGIVEVTLAFVGEVTRHGETVVSVVPLFELVPPRGLPAEFGTYPIGGQAIATIAARVRTGEGYGIEASALNIATIGNVVAVKVVMWGVPADPSHNAERSCPGGGSGCSAGGGLKPFLTDPTSCTGPLPVTARVDSYNAPGEYVGATETMSSGMQGCEKLQFAPGLTVTPVESIADSPTGLEVDLLVPQNENPTGIAEADLKNAEVKLPAGVTLNPSSANGLVGCPLLSGKEAHPGVSGIDLEDGEAAKCPNASKVGSVRIRTPLLEEELEGGIYVAQQGANPFKSLLALYIAAEAPERGVVVKLAGHVHLDSATGRLTTTFDENPQLPFEELKLDFFGGQRAPLATPRTCGSYTTTSVLEPWSHQPAPGEAAGTPNATPESSFKITSGPGGSACGPSPFAPVFEAGTASNQGGAFSPFVMTLKRGDGEQRFSTVDMTMPKGVAGMLSKVPLCTQAQAQADGCAAASQIGHVLVQAGVGSQPITLPESGKAEDPVYLLGPTEGAPFGLAIVVHPEAGPFNLEEGGRPVIVLAKVMVNPRTAQVSVASKAMPSILRGIPLDVRTIHVVIDRKGFMFNPTSCTPMGVAGTITSQEGASASVSSRFQAAGCRGLSFKPTFSALIHAKHSRKDGEYLHVVIGSAFGEANLARVHVRLPKQLPSRDSTLKLACSEAQFAANPAACPAGSVVGHAVVYTPVLRKPLTGPAIFVSHGGRAFPNLDLVLQGEGVTIVNEGDTFIGKKGITTSSFNAIPDVPVSRISLVLPAGPHSALAGEGNLCKGTLHMPATLTGQNGAVVSQKTKIMVEGCTAQIAILKHRVRGAEATIILHVPSAGRLTASGRGISKVSKQVSKHGGRVGITVRLKRHFRRLLAHRRRRHAITVTVHLRFKPPHGKAIAGRERVRLR